MDRGALDGLLPLLTTDLTCSSTKDTHSGDAFDGVVIEGRDAVRMVERDSVVDSKLFSGE